MFELLLYDLDGTLIDSKDDLADCVNMTLSELGFPILSNKIIYSYIGSGVRALLRDSIGSDQNSEYKRSLDIFKENYTANLLNKTHFYNGVIDVLKNFRNGNGKKQAIVTNKPIGYTEKIVKGLNSNKFFDLVIGSTDQIPLKPDPFMLNMAIEKLNVKKENVLMIGDGINDILAANVANVKVCAVGYGIGDTEDLVKLKPDFFIDNIKELPAIINNTF